MCAPLTLLAYISRIAGDDLRVGEHLDRMRLARGR